MSWFRKVKESNLPELTTSILYNEATFYNQFVKDLMNAKEEVIIESPYITTKRLTMLKTVFQRLVGRGVKVFIITRNPEEHDGTMASQSEEAVYYFEVLGAQVLLCKGGHHRKLAMIDRKVLWEGSLNILSQSNSREFMRRIESKKLTEEMFHFLNFDQTLHFKKKLDLV
jgi:phosphatidylserine/phosphatidylglycerophosphate/cardiolipin synthase-like enzyme